MTAAGSSCHVPQYDGDRVCSAHLLSIGRLSVQLMQQQLQQQQQADVERWKGSTASSLLILSHMVCRLKGPAMVVTSRPHVQRRFAQPLLAALA
jgi:hypothetical protein